jgi:hypothetical protein
MSRRPDPDIRDVPCLSCQEHYNEMHECDVPDHCPCDRRQNHLPPKIEFTYGPPHQPPVTLREGDRVKFNNTHVDPNEVFVVMSVSPAGDSVRCLPESEYALKHTETYDPSNTVKTIDWRERWRS